MSPASHIRRIATAIAAPVARHPRFFFAATVLGAAAPLAYDITRHTLLARFTAYALSQSALFAYLLCLLPARAPWRALRAAFLGLLALWAVVETAHAAMLGRAFDAASLSLVLDTNPAETGSFIHQYLTPSILGRTLLALAVLVLCALLPSAIFRRIARLPLALPAVGAVLLPVLVAGAAGILLCLSVLTTRTYDEFIAWCGQDNGNPDLARVYRLNCSDTPVKAVWLAKNITVEQGTLDAWRRVQRSIAGRPVQPVSPSAPCIVVIIGESFIKSHSSLYGYNLPVNPRLDSLARHGDLTVFTDVISAADFTIPSLRTLLNLNDLSRGEQWHQSAFWPLLLHRAGYSVSLYSNQYAPRRAASGLDGMLYAPELTRGCYTSTADTTFAYDLDFVSHVARRTIPAAPAAPAPRLVLWHLVGQHFAAADRYPHTPDFSRFTAAHITSPAPWLNGARRAEVAHYDNATAYNDSVVASIISLYAASDAVLFYFSDHGEEVWDKAPYGSRNEQHPDDPDWLRRHFDIPFFVWTSPSFRSARPDLAARIAAAASKPFMLDNLGQTILGIAGIRDTLYRPDRDLFSPLYAPAPRVTSAGYTYDATVSSAARSRH